MKKHETALMNPSLDSILKEMQNFFHSFQLSEIKHVILLIRRSELYPVLCIPEDKTSRLYLIMSTGERLTIS